MRIVEGARAELADAFLEKSGWGEATRSDFPRHDASGRHYEYVSGAKGRVLLMDWPPAAGGPQAYRRDARLADRADSFVAIGTWLLRIGLSAPVIYATDYENGFLLLEDLGEFVYESCMGEHLTAPEPWDVLYRAGVDVLLHLHAAPPPRMLEAPGAHAVSVPKLDIGVCLTEARLFLDWYLPAQEIAPDAEMTSAYDAMWRVVFARMNQGAAVLVLRDYHSPNMIWCGARAGVRRVGIIDFQDALMGDAAYDLVSFLQDARVDVAPEREDAMYAYYVAERKKHDAHFDADAFRAAYVLWGAQRALKVAGIFRRFANLDGKPDYLRHERRVLAYLARNLAHPACAPLSRFLKKINVLDTLGT